MTVPEISAGFSIPINFSSAMIEVYSVPCAPATSASTGPGFAPWKTATGMLRPASTPGGTSMVPVALCPRAAVAVPTVKVPRGCATDTTTRTDASNPTAETNRIMIISHQINSVRLDGGSADRTSKTYRGNPTRRTKSAKRASERRLSRVGFVSRLTICISCCS